MAHFHFNGNSKQALYHPYRRVDKTIKNKETVSRAIEERQIRESNIKHIKSSIVIQSHYRAHVARCKLKEEFKEEIDVEIKSVESVLKLFRLITKFFYAYQSERKFANGDDYYSRLLLIMSQMLKNVGEIGKEIMTNMTNDKISMICMVTSIKKVLALCIRFISNNASQQDVSLDVPLQMIKDFTCLNTYLRGQSSNEVKDHAFALVTNIVDYLFNNDYYSAIKSLIGSRLQTAACESQTGLFNDILLFDNINCLRRNTRSKAYHRMILELFAQPMKNESKKYLLMNLTNPSFPYMEMLESLSLIHLNQLTSAQVLDLFHCLLSLAEPHYANMKFDDLCIYFKIIVDFTNCLHEKIDASYLSDDEKDLEYRKFSCVLENETNEDADNLIELCFDLFGNNHSLSNRLMEFLGFKNGCLLSSKIISYLCKICYNLTAMQSQKNSRHYSFFKVLGSSSFFIRKLWEILNDPTEFSSFSCKINSKTDLQFFSTFCNTFKHHLTEDYSAENINMESNTKPFDGLLDISSSALTIVDCCSKMYFMICTSYKNNMEFRRVFKEATQLVRCLYDLDNNIKFMNGKIWAVHSLPQLVLPFYGIAQQIIKQKESEEKYVALRDRLMIILEELPFVFTFESKIEFFRNDARYKLHKRINFDRMFSRNDSKFKLNNLNNNGGMFIVNDGILYINGNSAAKPLLRRNHIYEDAFQKIQIDKEVDITKSNRYGFINIFGHQETYYRPLKEVLNLVIMSGFNPDIGLFKETSERFLYPDPLSEFSKEEYLEHYYFLGMILGTAILENLTFNLPFASFFLTKLLGKHSDKLNFHHMSSLDPVLYKNLLYLRDTDDVESMDLYFNLEYEVQGSLKTVDLKPNGSSILVDNNNKHEYIRLFADWHLNKRIRKHCIAFKKGLLSIAGFENLRIFDHKELQFIISGGNAPIDIEDLKMHTTNSGKCNMFYPEVIKNFWSVVGEMTETQKEDLLKFATGNRRPPPFGFKRLDPRFKISIGKTSPISLPTSTTCINTLHLGAYENREILKEKLLKAITPGFDDSI